jgi:hypothetical protein
MRAEIELSGSVLIADIRNHLPDILLDYGEDLKEEIANMMAESGGGVHYEGNPNPSSRPGEAPAIQSGNLVESLTAELTAPLTVEVYTDEPYGEMLELGTKHIAPRPSFTPVFHHAEHEFEEVIGDRVIEIAERHSL